MNNEIILSNTTMRASELKHYYRKYVRANLLKAKRIIKDDDFVDTQRDFNLFLDLDEVVLSSNQDFTLVIKPNTITCMELKT